MFPSIVETFGLPLLEAKLSKTKIFCMETDFSREILTGYESALFFKNSNQLSDLIMLEINAIIKKKIG